MGRWRIENSNTQINNKIDLSNEDHCGPCGQYALSKIEITPPTDLSSTHDVNILNCKKFSKK